MFSTRKIISFFYPLYQLACYGLLWGSIAIVTWTVVRKMVGDNFIESFSQLISY